MKKIIIILGISILMVSCSDNLSNSTAKKQIIKRHQLPNIETKIIEYKDMHVAWRVTYDGLKPFISKGLLHSEYRGRGLYGHLYTEPTSKGKKYVINDNGNSFEAKLATLEFGEILGIVEYSEYSTAEVKYSLVRKEITPFGRASNIQEGSTIIKKATFIKYNDGWRIE